MENANLYNAHMLYLALSHFIMFSTYVNILNKIDFK